MPLLWLSLAFLAGILLASTFSLPTWVWVLSCGISLSLGLIRYLFGRFPNRFGDSINQLLSHFPSLPVPLFMIALVLFLGGARYQSVQPDLDDPAFIASYNDQVVE